MAFDATMRFVLLAQQAAPGGGFEMFQLLVPFGIIMVLYFVIIGGPERKAQRQRQEMIQSLKKNDKVLTSSGIFGVVTNIVAESDEVTLRVDETNNTKLRVLRSSIVRVLSDEGGSKKESESVA